MQAERQPPSGGLLFFRFPEEVRVHFVYAVLLGGNHPSHPAGSTSRLEEPRSLVLRKSAARSKNALKERATHCSPDFLAFPGQPHESCSQVDTHLSEPWHPRRRRWCWVEGRSKKRQGRDSHPSPQPPPASDSERLSHQRFTLYRPRINNSEVQSGKFLLCAAFSS